jgi:hypothetical protein
MGAGSVWASGLLLLWLLLLVAGDQGEWEVISVDIIVGQRDGARLFMLEPFSAASLAGSTI